MTESEKLDDRAEIRAIMQVEHKICSKLLEVATSLNLKFSDPFPAKFIPDIYAQLAKALESENPAFDLTIKQRAALWEIFVDYDWSEQLPEYTQFFVAMRILRDTWKGIYTSRQSV
jgi:hypothetical protein